MYLFVGSTPRWRRLVTSSKSATSKPSSSSNQYQYFGLILGLIGKLLHSVVSVLLMRGGKRLYMIGTFITACWLQGEINNNGFTNIFPGSVSNSALGGFNIFQGVRALQDCPEHYVARDYNSYDVGMKVTHEENVYECTESPCMWKVIGTCTDNVFWPLSSTASYRNMQAVSLDEPSMPTEPNPTEPEDSSESEAQTNLPTRTHPSISTLPARPGISNNEHVTSSESRRISESSLLRTTNHNQSPHAMIRQSVVEGEEQVLFYPDWYSTKCVNDPDSVFSSQSFVTLEECCEQW